MNRLSLKRTEHILLLVASSWILTGACAEFYNIAWGTGNWLGQFSPKWFLFFLLFVLFCLSCLGGVLLFLWFPEKLVSSSSGISKLQDGLRRIRWLLVILILGAPVYFFQYTPWGVIFAGQNFRALIWTFSVILIGWLLHVGSEEIISWKEILCALVLTAGVYNFFARVDNITNYPFSLGWSEGNRLWDYSVLFGHSIYKYPVNKIIPVYLDIGRQFVGGVPFLIPGITIWQERLWLGLVNVIPYLILGWIAFKSSGKRFSYWILAGVWAFTFVEQGPIQPPLLLSAILVAFAWERTLWLAIPLILGASYFAEVSRSTWLFAPGMWAVMLEFASAPLQDGRLGIQTWRRAVAIGMAGIFGGLLGPKIFPILFNWLRMLFGHADNTIAGGGISLAAIQTSVSDQPLLWYRLLPNATYGYGILFGLFLAVTPLMVILIQLSKTRQWVLNTWQKLAIVSPLLAFLFVGLIVSVKIGGGGDLHNMDMFIIGLMFAGAIAWHSNSTPDWIEQNRVPSLLLRITFLILIIMPTLQPYMGLSPNAIEKQDLKWVMLLADMPLTQPFSGTLRSKADTSEALAIIRHEVANASRQGDVLFMDQRQLLTFGYIGNVLLVPEYDKKVLIDKAMSEDSQYFDGFYHDLASHRFSLIITNPLRENIQTDAYDFNEENNAWVKWVSIPTLCYYEPLFTLRKVAIQLLVPRADISNCSQVLP